MADITRPMAAPRGEMKAKVAMYSAETRGRTPEVTNCVPTQKEMTYLCDAMAKKMNQTDLMEPVKPRAIPSNTACRERASITRKPRRVA